MTDKELSRLLRDRSGFSRVYEELKQPVYTVCLRILNNRELAEDVCHDVFLKLYHCPPDSSVLKPRAWVFRMARNLAIDALRQKDNQRREPLEEIQAAYTPDWDLRLDLEAALAALSVAEREAVTLHLNAELSFQEIAGITGTSLPSVYRTYRRGLKKLKVILNGGEL